MKALFSDKNSASNKVTIIENDFLDKNVLDNIDKMAGAFNTYFTNVMAELHIPKYEGGHTVNIDHIADHRSE